MTLLQRLASVGLGRREEERGAGAARRDAADASHACRRCRRRPRPGRGQPPGAGVGIRQAAARRRGSTSTAGRRLCTSLWTTISSKSRPSCAGRPTDAAPRHGAGPRPQSAGARVVSTAAVERRLVAGKSVKVLISLIFCESPAAVRRPVRKPN